MNKIELLYRIFKESTGVSIDSRTIEIGEIFFALVGDRFDGHQYVEAAITKGASVVVVKKKCSTISVQKQIIVQDTEIALQELARYHRSQFQIPVLGITGSNGKTTTKELLSNVLSEKYKVHCTEGNLNNHLGVPLTILRMDNSTEFAVIEMGANHLGEIDFLCQIAKPNAGLVTNIGSAHIGEFGSQENIIETKLSLLKYVQANGGVLFINQDDKRIANVFLENILFVKYSLGQILNKNGSQAKLIFENNPKELNNNYQITTSDGKSNQFTSRLYGLYNQVNIVASIACGLYWEVPLKKIGLAIQNYVPKNKRSQILRYDSNIILLDAYNANPDSMRAAIEEIDRIENKRKVLILGDMLELGSYSSQEHDKLLEWVLCKKFEEIYLVGNQFPEKTGCSYYKNWEDLNGVINWNKFDNTIILIKGSRSIALENLITDFL